MRFTSFTGPKSPAKHGKNAKVAKSTRVCPPTCSPSLKINSCGKLNHKMADSRAASQKRCVFEFGVFFLGPLGGKEKYTTRCNFRQQHSLLDPLVLKTIG